MPTVHGYFPRWPALLLCAFAFLYVFPYFPALNNPNENVRLYMAAALLEHGTYEIDAIRTRWGWVNDAACVDRLPDGVHQPCESAAPPATATRHYYSIKAPLTSLLALPGYALEWFSSAKQPDRTRALWFSRVSASIVPMLLFSIVFLRFLRATVASQFSADAVFLGSLLGTCLLAYTYLLCSHATSAAAAFSAFVLLHDARRRRGAGDSFSSLARGNGRFHSWARDLAAGACAAAATGFDYQALIASVLLCVQAALVLRPRARLLVFGLGALVPTLLVAHFQWRAFGSPFRPGHVFAETGFFRETHMQGLYGIHSFDAAAMLQLLVSPRVGMFTTGVILLPALAGMIVRARRPRERLEAWFGIATVLGLLLTLSSMRNWNGGWATGARLLTVVIPYVAWFAAAGLDALIRRQALLGMVVGLALQMASFVSGGLPAMYYPHIPEEFRVPIRELILPLIRYDFAPSTALNLLGVGGTLSMLPMLGVELLAVFLLSRYIRSVPRRVALVGLALACVPLLLVPSWYATEPLASPGSLGFVTQNWTPQGYDRAARARQRAIQAPSAAHEAELRQVLQALGRAGERSSVP